MPQKFDSPEKSKMKPKPELSTVIPSKVSNAARGAKEDVKQQVTNTFSTLLNSFHERLKQQEKKMIA